MSDRQNRYLIYLTLLILSGWLLYLGRAILTPFFLAAAFAYILNPVVAFLTHKIRLPRTLSIALIYLVIMGALTIGVVWIGSTLTEESREFSQETHSLISSANSQIATLPDFLQAPATDLIETARSALFLPHRRAISYLPGAINRTLSALIFLVAMFYFLRDGHLFLKNFLNLFPPHLHFEVEVIWRKINQVLGNYLRAQLSLIIIMATMTYVGLTIIEVKFALIISIFTGIAEIVPFVGPLVAAAVAMFVAYTDGISRFSANPMMDVIAVAALYTVLRQVEDFFIAPQIMGRMTKLHPLLVLFAVILGGHLLGVIGFLIAVPLVASFKVVFEHVLSKQKALQD